MVIAAAAPILRAVFDPEADTTIARRVCNHGGAKQIGVPALKLKAWT